MLLGACLAALTAASATFAEDADQYALLAPRRRPGDDNASTEAPAAAPSSAATSTGPWLPSNPLMPMISASGRGISYCTARTIRQA